MILRRSNSKFLPHYLTRVSRDIQRALKQKGVAEGKTEVVRESFQIAYGCTDKDVDAKIHQYADENNLLVDIGEKKTTFYPNDKA